MYFLFKHLIYIRRYTRTMPASCNIFKLSQYDVIALDFDNTLLQYNLRNFFRLQYSYLTRYLIEKKGYEGLPTTMSNSDVDFIRRGLFLDINRGNILNISASGTIIQASHGTKKLSVNDVIDVYGPERRWYPLDVFLKDKVISIANDQIYSFLDFTDCLAILVYAKTIDLVDKSENRSSEYKPVWTDLLEAIIDMYRIDSEFILTIGNNLSQYVYQCDAEILGWLKKLKETSKLMLITSAEPAILEYTVKYCLGAEWQELFHTIIDSAGKPKFFSKKISFKDTNNMPIELNTSRGYYRNGNWQDIQRILTEELGRPVKCVYIGDNILHDICAPSTNGSPPMDTISILEESLAEGYFQGIHPYAEYIKSDFWGSTFQLNGIPTVVGDIIMKHSKLCIPLIKYLAHKPLDYEHVPFWAGLKFNEDNSIKSEQLKMVS